MLKASFLFLVLFYRMDKTVKHIEVLLDEATQKYRVKDESDAVCYANFLQFDSIQQLLDQCKQHPSILCMNLNAFNRPFPSSKNPHS